MSKKPDLKVKLDAIELQNPVMSASGTFGYAREFEGLVDLNRLGAIIVKGLSLEPTKGNPPPRIVETPCGMLNAIGLENVGIDVFEKQKLPFLQTLYPPIFANIYGTSIEEYAELSARVDELEAISGVEVNISCPNVKAGGIAFGVDPDSAFSVVKAVRKKTRKHLIVKLSPNVTDITIIARSAEEAGPIHFPLSTPLPVWPLILKPGIRRSPTSPAVCRVPLSNRLLCEWCGRWRKRSKSR